MIAFFVRLVVKTQKYNKEIPYMLTDIQIRNFAIVESLAIELHKGMIVLTGETGAGKSILLDALNLVLGGRADSSFIRHGCERAEISATFLVSDNPDINYWLKHNELDADGEAECIIRRTINADGRSKGYINGYPVPIQSMRELGELLVDARALSSTAGRRRSRSCARPANGWSTSTASMRTSRC